MGKDDVNLFFGAQAGKILKKNMERMIKQLPPGFVVGLMVMSPDGQIVFGASGNDDEKAQRMVGAIAAQMKPGEIMRAGRAVVEELMEKQEKGGVEK